MSNDQLGGRARRSREVFTPLLVTAGLIGLPAVLGVAGCARDEKPRDEAVPPTVSAAESYPNNHFLPGAGYYHSPFHAWFPFPYNHYVDGRGWFRGGAWRASAQQDALERTDALRAGSFGGRAAPGAAAGFLTDATRPSPEAVSRANAAAATHARSSLLPRGGFGHSSRPGVT